MVLPVAIHAARQLAAAALLGRDERVAARAVEVKVVTSALAPMHELMSLVNERT